jgi:hypothetical protein
MWNVKEYVYFLMVLYWMYKTLATPFQILSCTPFCPQNSLNSSEHGPYKVSKAFYGDAGSCWLPCFPQLCQVGWINFGWWIILDTHGKLLSMKTPPPLQFLTHLNLAPTTLFNDTYSKNTVLPVHPLKGTCTQSMPQLYQGLKILLY